MLELQNHIHLSRTMGGAPENAPNMKWKVRADGWLPVPEVIQTVNRTLSGKLVKHRLRIAGEVAKLTNYRYILRVDNYWGFTQQQRYDALMDMHGQEVFLVDALHLGDNLDHTLYVKPMYMQVISDIAPINPAMAVLYISVELTDDSL